MPIWALVGQLYGFAVSFGCIAMAFSSQYPDLLVSLPEITRFFQISDMTILASELATLSIQ